MQKKIQEICFDFEITAFELVGDKDSLLLRKNTCQRVSICQQTVSRFQLLLK